MNLKICLLLPLVTLGWSHAGATDVPNPALPDKLITVAGDPRVQLVMHPPVRVMTEGGRQPFLFCSAQGTLLSQAQIGGDKEPFRTKGKIVYPIRLGMAISRDGGITWAREIREKDHDDVNLEGGVLQLKDGTIYMLDSFVIPGAQPDQGVGEVWKSHDDFRTWEGPTTADIHLPGIKFTGSTDDYGRQHAAARLHRSILELPNGELLATMYAWFNGDTAPASYIPSMKKTRVVLLRSRDRGASWAYLSTVAVDGGVGTEGFGEPVLVRVSRGVHAGRLICQMRTGRDLYEAMSGDDGVTWSVPAAVSFPGINIRDVGKWKGLFADPTAPNAVPTDDMIGDFVDPDLIEMRDGTLVSAIGVRIPARKCFQNWHAPQNGDYLAFSCDGGDTWSHVVQFRSGAPTTHYMGIREIAPGALFVVYDDSIWKMEGETMGFRLDVKRTDLPPLAR
jgi:hypothetical protein